MRNLNAVFYNGCTNIRSHPQCRSSLFSTSSLLLVVFLIITILTHVRPSDFCWCHKKQRNCQGLLKFRPTKLLDVRKWPLILVIKICVVYWSALDSQNILTIPCMPHSRDPLLYPLQRMFPIFHPNGREQWHLCSIGKYVEEIHCFQYILNEKSSCLLSKLHTYF